MPLSYTKLLVPSPLSIVIPTNYVPSAAYATPGDARAKMVHVPAPMSIADIPSVTRTLRTISLTILARLGLCLYIAAASWKFSAAGSFAGHALPAASSVERCSHQRGALPERRHSLWHFAVL
ncbi:hypothetical protein R1flu_011119 [Riccia fluitans]|uniref:Uncharacterized protein n=1 Tax=Riccia fluitans TaxID=41844 RepID=A0ABD1ZB25_9MARC